MMTYVMTHPMSCRMAISDAQRRMLEVFRVDPAHD